MDKMKGADASKKSIIIETHNGSAINESWAASIAKLYDGEKNHRRHYQPFLQIKLRLMKLRRRRSTQQGNGSPPRICTSRHGARNFVLFTGCRKLLVDRHLFFSPTIPPCKEVLTRNVPVHNARNCAEFSPTPYILHINHALRGPPPYLGSILHTGSVPNPFDPPGK